MDIAARCLLSNSQGAIYDFEATCGSKIAAGQIHLLQRGGGIALLAGCDGTLQRLHAHKEYTIPSLNPALIIYTHNVDRGCLADAIDRLQAPCPVHIIDSEEHGCPSP
jgi:hypothetical protein